MSGVRGNTSVPSLTQVARKTERQYRENTAILVVYCSMIRSRHVVWPRLETSALSLSAVTKLYLKFWFDV